MATICDGPKSTGIIYLWYYMRISMILWRYLLDYGVDVHPVHPKPKISLLRLRALSSRTLSATYADCECNANSLILRVILASAMAPDKNALGAFYLPVVRRFGHFETICLPDGKNKNIAGLKKTNGFYINLR